MVRLVVTKHHCNENEVDTDHEIKARYKAVIVEDVRQCTIGRPEHEEDSEPRRRKPEHLRVTMKVSEAAGGEWNDSSLQHVVVIEYIVVRRRLHCDPNDLSAGDGDADD